jgi:hypothetical protein
MYIVAFSSVTFFTRVLAEELREYEFFAVRIYEFAAKALFLTCL